MNSARKVSFHTLGCKLNFSETSTLSRQMAESGFARATRGEKSDVCIVNTCSVTDHADKKCRNIIRKIIRENPEALVVVTGCYAQLKPEEISAIEGVDIVVGNGDKGSIIDKVRSLTSKQDGLIYGCDSASLASFFSSFSSNDRTRSFLKIQDGCDYKCAYCTIPLARGNSRNIPISEVLSQAEQIARSGHKEIVITGINTGDFGRTTGEKFSDLLKELDKIDGIERYRISSIEPNLLTDEIIEICSLSAKFQPHFHIPLQSGSDTILAAMRRRYNTAKFAERVDALRAKIEDPFIGIDVIVGFPGETDELFQQTYEFLKKIKPAFLHVFPYSVRMNTPAAEMRDKTDAKISAARVKILTELSDKLYDDYCIKYTNRNLKVLFEGTKQGGMMFGHSENYILVHAPYDRSAINTITEVYARDYNCETKIMECELL